MTFTHHSESWPLSSEGSLTCHTYCDTGQPFILVISEDPWYLHLLPSVRQWCDTACFNDLGLSRPGIEPRSLMFHHFETRSQHSKYVPHARQAKCFLGHMSHTGDLWFTSVVCLSVISSQHPQGQSLPNRYEAPVGEGNIKLNVLTQHNMGGKKSSVFLLKSSLLLYQNC